MGQQHPPTITIGSYLLARLHQLGVNSVFGVPGDYNLRLLDKVAPEGLHWIGNCNELNAAYAADGYARIKRLAVLVTTFGLGELSAINGIAGAYAEKVLVVHILGTPSRQLQNSGAPLHHSFVDGGLKRFAATAEHVTAAQTDLRDFWMAAGQIDWVLQKALRYSRPVYRGIPEDMVNIEISSTRLVRQCILASTEEALPVEKSLVKRSLGRIYSSHNPCILVDGETRVIDALQEVDQLVQTTSWPTFTTPFGKGLINEQLPNVYGVCTSAFGDDKPLSCLQASDLVLGIGLHISDTNTQSYATLPNDKVLISLSHPAISFAGKQ